jgi:membrane-associated phospholipid phosphatase
LNTKKTLNFKNIFFIFLFCTSAFAQRREFQEGSGNQLVQFEKLLPAKSYDYSTSDLQVKWHLMILDLIEQTPGYTPNIAARNMAYINLGAYEAILPAYKNLSPLVGQLQGYSKSEELDIDTSNFIPQVAMNMAFYKLIDEFFVAAPYVWMEKATALRDSVNLRFAKTNPSLAMIKSKNYGLSIADLVLTYAATDGGLKALFRSYDLNYALPKCESCFEINRVADLENTGPLHPTWGKNRTFLAANTSEAIAVKPSHQFSKYKDSGFYKEALEVYKTSLDAIPGSEKNNIANFWDDAATYSYTAVGHSVAILTQILRSKSMRTDSAAAYYLTLTLGLNDAMINTWKIKYTYNVLRPGAYIKKYIDSKWEPAILTPPFPEFPSGHSAQSAAMATILTELLGDKIAFTDFSKFWVGAPRKFVNFWAAANETSISRMYGGIHFKDALTQGQALGKMVGKNALGLKTLR